MNSFASLVRVVLPLVALAIASVAWCSEPLNPKPCTDPYKCDFPPTIGEPSGDNIVCWGTTGSWSIDVLVRDGQKSKCQQPPEPVKGRVTSCSWSLSGPETAQGSGSSFSYTPKSCGDYVITWTVDIDSDEPCEDYTVTKTDNFNVPTPPLSTTVESVEVCPGKEKKSHWTITNTSDECGYEYWYYVTIADGDPTVNIFGGDDTVYVGPGETQEGDLTIKVPQSTKRGVKNLNWYVFTKCEVSGGQKWTVTVPPVNMGGNIPDIEICPLEQGKKLKWKITNNGTCTEVVTLDGTYDPKNTVTTVGALGNQGGEIEPGQSLEGEMDVTCDANSPGGTGEYTLKVSVDPLGVVATIVAKVTVPDPKGDFAFGPIQGTNGKPLGSTKLSPGAKFRLPFDITNTGKCTDTYEWVITCDNPDVKLTGALISQTTKGPGESGHWGLRGVISSDARRGPAVITAVMHSRGQPVDEDIVTIYVAKCEVEKSPTTVDYQWDTNGPYAKKYKDFLQSVIDNIQGKLGSLPGVTITPKVPTVAGSYSHKEGDECCPGAIDPSPYTEDKGTGSISAGVQAKGGPTWAPIFAWKPRWAGGRQIQGQAFIGLLLSLSVDAAGSISVTGHNGACNNCTTVSGKVDLSATGSVKVGVEGKVIYTDADGVDTELKAELTGSGEIKGTMGSIAGATNFGAECKKKDSLKGCTGPLDAYARVRVRFGGASISVKDWEYRILDEICYPPK